MVAHIVVSEGLAYIEEQEKQNCCLSDYFQAVLDRVIETVPSSESVFVSHANNFGCEFSEDKYAAEYLANKRPDLKVYVPLDVRDRPYLDTFDNARLLRLWLEKQDLWPLEELNLYCNQPHSLRSFLMFRLCEFKVKQVIGCRPQQIRRKIVPRLWFYDYSVVQIFYESSALLYNLLRWLKWKIKAKK